MKVAVSGRLSTAQRRYQRHSDKNNRQEPTFKRGYYVLVDCDELPAFASDAADEMANR